MTVKPRADGRYDVNDCLADYDDWDDYRHAHGDIPHTVDWALELLDAFVQAVRYGTP